MDVKLVVRKGAAASQTLVLNTAQTLVGRQRGCAVRVPSALVSRRHCQLTFENDLLSVEDLGSANGTLVNGQRIDRPRYLRPGDTLQIGPVTLLVHYQLSPAAFDRLLVEEAPSYQESILLVPDDESVPLVMDEPLQPVDDAPNDLTPAALASWDHEATRRGFVLGGPGHEPNPLEAPSAPAPKPACAPRKTKKASPAQAKPAAAQDENLDDAENPDASQILGSLRGHLNLPHADDIRDILAKLEKGKKK